MGTMVTDNGGAVGSVDGLEVAVDGLGETLGAGDGSNEGTEKG